MSQTCDEYTQDLARRIRDAIVGLYGIEHELTEDLLEHVICEALFHAARDVRAGRIARLEYLGEIACIDGEPAFRADDWLRTPNPFHFEEDAA